jgi:hypothetical protein
MTAIPTHDLSAHRHAEGQTPQRARPPPDPPCPWHIGLPISGSRCGHRQAPGTGGSRAHCHRPGRVPTGRDRGGGALDSDACATVSWLFGGPGRHRRRRLARAGPGRDGQVHPAVPGPHRYLRRHPRGGEPPDGSTTRPSPGRCWRPAWPSARAAATSARGTPGNAHSAARDMSGQLKAHAQDEVDDASCVTTHLRRWALPGPLWCGSAEARRSGQSARCHPALAAQLTCTRNRRSGRRPPRLNVTFRD